MASKSLTILFRIKILILIFCTFVFSQLYSQDLLLRGVSNNPDSIIDIVKTDTFSFCLVFSKYVNIEKNNDGEYWLKYHQGIITHDSNKIYIDGNQEYVGNIDDIVYTADYSMKNIRIIRSFKLINSELVLINQVKVEKAFGFFYIDKCNRLIVFFDSYEGFGDCIIVYNKDLMKVLDYKPFMGFYSDFSINNMLHDSLVISFRSVETSNEYRVLCIDTKNYKIITDQKINLENINIDRIISFEEKSLLIGCYDDVGYRFILLNPLTSKILNSALFCLDTKLLDISNDEVFFYSNKFLYSYKAKSFKENWRVDISVDKNETISISNIDACIDSKISTATKSHLILISRYNAQTASFIDNKFVVVDNTGHIDKSIPFSNDVHSNTYELPAFQTSKTIKIFSGHNEIELIVN